ncbi:MAG: efflux RND transporter periplasmic adaptor subunit [Proteobacteria bacterium]|nr:efflux RND transporter periplasmic adaptor subunit [Pseudomonadota bacterium]
MIKRWLPRLIGLAIVAGGVALVMMWKPWATQASPITFSTVPVTRGAIAAQVTANGTLSARGTVQVGAQVSGRVVQLGADFNDPVKKGQLIARLDDSVLKSQLDQANAAMAVAQANVAKAQVALADAERQLKRQKSLQDQQLVAGITVEQAQVVYDTAKTSLVAARAQTMQTQANVSTAKQNLAYATILSPVDGVVLSRAVELGQTVAASLSAPTLFTIAEDLALMQIDTAVSEADVGRLDKDMLVTFTVDAFSGKQFDGVVRQVRNAPTTTQGVVTYDAVIDVVNKDKQLRPGMTANVTFVLEQVADTIKIPNSALRFKPAREQMQAAFAELGRRGSGSGSGGWRRDGGSGSGGGGSGRPREGRPMGGPNGPPDRKQLYKLVDGKPKMVFVKVGLTDGSMTQLVEGDLQPGDQLITEIQGLPAAPGRKVTPF